MQIDDSLSPEAKDLLRRMLKPDPNERASIPEVLSHCWLRARHAATCLELQPRASALTVSAGAERAAEREKERERSEREREREAAER
jgi:serine/threonine protein kinase